MNNTHDARASGPGADRNFQLYRYTPSHPAAIVSVIIFAILTSLHRWGLLRVRAYYFIAFAIGGIFQTIGYCGRIWSHYDIYSIGGFVIQAILILVAPALHAASIYMILDRLVRTVRAGGGGVQSAGTLDLYKVGEKIIIAGLFVQICIFGFFVFTSFLFHYRIHQNPTSESTQRNDGYLISHEIFLYNFDTLLMAVVMVILLVWYVEHLQGLKQSSGLEGQEMSACSSYGIVEPLGNLDLGDKDR
ncbi:hypothetical protein B0T10DRAFT_532145 [Thelonectria olida]|uniref:Uncharacterized protein n=1 Tax=Thelonectria olida TaxID=1576542 RepID=A0A9P8VUF4_9HYPO|nr:hypothetical protein B0T10DRAFT_532145 [Thelonectria olida]